MLHNFYKKYLLLLFFTAPLFCLSQQNKQVDIATKIATAYQLKEKKEYDSLLIKAKQKGWALTLKSSNQNQIIKLRSIDSKGFPVYTTTDNNTTSAATTHTNYLWQNDFNLSGSSQNIKGKIAMWDGGSALNNHIEINGRILNKDFSSNQNHSTHVAGTLMANGTNSVAKGMAFGAEQLLSYDFINHISEIALAAPNLLVSNHSYGDVCGWNKLGNGDWVFFGNTNDTADYKFGIYNTETQMLDSIAYNFPNYLIVKSAGNNRDINGPTVGQPYFTYNYNTQEYVAAGNRSNAVSNNDSYDIIPTYGCAKNILTIGAIEGIASGSTKMSDIKMSSFSSWGPTDDGRIKPDLVANGVDVLSCSNNGNSSYEIMSGTSMATPNVTGSLFLLQELYSKKNNGNFMKASTVKALAIHTANETGNAPGPNYKFGWGLLNAEKAANIINDVNATTSKIIEHTLNNNDTFKLNVIASGNGKLMTTIVWTDIVGEATTTNLLNNPALKLANDLDIRIIKDATTYFPWLLNPAIPSLAATKGDNFRDNVERVEIDNAIAGQTYTIQVTHKGILQRGKQAFSLIVSGIGGSTYCNPFTINNGGVKIDSFRFSNIYTTNFTCNNYYNNTHLIAQLEPSKIYTINIGLSNCNNTGNNKIAKLYIDYNNNGSFADANELVLTSGVIAGIGNVSSTITIPNNTIIGKKILMRLVVVETNIASSFDACNPALIEGAIQDYQVEFINAAKDVAVTEIILPTTNTCFSNAQYLSARITNVGDSAVANIPLTATIKIGTTIIAVLTGNYTPQLLSGESVVYTFQNSFNTNTDSSYSIFVNSSLIDDQNNLNNLATNNFTIKFKPNVTTGQVDICNNLATLKVFGGNVNQNYVWYNSPINTTPIAAGETASTTIISNKYYVSSGVATNLGAVDKTISISGDYQAKGGNYFIYSATKPVLLDNAKIYTAYPGKVIITVADIKTINADGTYTYTTLNSTTINVLASRHTQVSGNVSGNDATDTGLIYNINLLLPQGNHALIVATDSVANIFRNNNITANPYPYSIPNIITITGNNATMPNNFYYYLYNMKIKTLDCVGDKITIVPTVAALPSITQANDTLSCNTAINYQWQKDGVDLVGETNQKYKFTTTANYTVIATDFSGCKQSSKSYNPANKYGLTVYPNPAKSIVNIEFTSNETAYMQINIYDIIGRNYVEKISATSSHSFVEKINVLGLPNGIYFIKILHGSKSYNQKLVVAR